MMTGAAMARKRTLTLTVIAQRRVLKMDTITTQMETLSERKDVRQQGSKEDWITEKGLHLVQYRGRDL